MRRTLGADADLAALPPRIRELLELVDDAYRQGDEDRRMLERSLDLSSEELLAANGELRALFASLPDLFLRVRPEGELVDLRGGADDHRTLLPGAAVGDSIWSCLAPSAAEPLREAFDALVAERRPFVVQYAVGEGDDLQHVEARLRLLPKGDVMIVARDVSDSVRAAAEQAERLQQQARNKALEEFAYVASHDLRAPLRAIANLTEFLEEDLAEIAPEESRAHLDILRRRVARMDNLLVALLDYARVGRSDATVEPVAVTQLVDGVIELLGNETFTFSVEPMPTITTARGPLERVFLNLITNAIKHHDRDDGHIEIGAIDRPGEAMTFYVQDDGPGIPVEARERVFQMFKQLGRRDDAEGSGMGLALIKRIVAEAGGEIRICDSEGGGCRFEFTWPAIE